MSPETERIIREAATNRRMLMIKYTGIERLVEPYSFRDGKNGVLFYGFCMMHEKIHSFNPEKIEEIQITNRSFVPRWTIEL